MSSALHLLGLMFDALDDGVCVADHAGRVVYANTAARRLLGGVDRLREETMCQSVCARLLQPGGLDCKTTCPVLTVKMTSAALRGKLDGALEVRARCEPLSSPLFAGLGPGLRLLLLQEAVDEADAERRREDWRHMLVHDMRSPLSNVVGVLRLIEETHGCTDPQEKELLEVSLRSCRKVLQLLDEYLDVAKLEAGLMPVREEPVELDRLVERIIAENAPLAREKKLRVETRRRSHVVARGDPALIERVLQNVLSNAVKFSPKGGKIVVDERCKGAQAEVRVKDDGPGITAEEKKHLFERFFQTKAAGGGTGLGLSFCLQALRAMHGAITVSSQPGRGSEFIVRLPASRA